VVCRTGKLRRSAGHRGANCTIRRRRVTTILLTVIMRRCEMAWRGPTTETKRNGLLTRRPDSLLSFHRDASAL